MAVRKIYQFIGKTPFFLGGISIFIGFITFLLDVGLASCLQRFFMASGLVEAGEQTPLSFFLSSYQAEAALLIFVSVIRGIVLWYSGYITGACQVKVEEEKRKQISDWAIYSGREGIGHVMTLYNDIVIGTAASVSNIFYVMARVLMLCGLLAVMAWHSLSMTLIALAFAVSIVPIQMAIDRRVSRNAKKIQESLALSVSRLSTAIKNNIFIHLHALEGQESGWVAQQIDAYKKSSVRYYTLTSLRTIIPQVAGIIAVCLISIQGHISFQGNMGNLVAYLYFVLRFFQILSDIGRVSGNLRLNAPRVSILWQWWNNSYNPSTVQARHIETERTYRQESVGWRGRDISFSYAQGAGEILQAINFEIVPGSLTLIAGPSGSGKTTLLYLLMGLFIPKSGQVEWRTASEDYRPLTSRLPASISYVGPEPFLIAGNVRAQLNLGQKESYPDSDLEQALKDAHADFVFSLPGGLNYELSEQGIGLSAGQKQRLSLARALLKKPSVLVLDEATANLDIETETLILQTIQNLRGKMSILMVSHRPHKDLMPDQIIDLTMLKMPRMENVA